MRFLARLDFEYEDAAGKSGGTSADHLPTFVTDCQRRRRHMCLEHADFFSSVTVRKGGPPDDTKGENRLWHWHLTESPTPTPTIELGNLARSQALDWTYRGEYFTYLLTKSDPGRTNAYVGWSTNPLRDVCHLNARQDSAGGGGAGGGWELAAVVALFTCPELAADFGQALVTGTRGYLSKLEKIPWLAVHYNKSLYIYKEAPTVALPELLSCYSDPAFTELYRTLQELK
jgi:hypothetical protein